MDDANASRPSTPPPHHVACGSSGLLADAALGRARLGLSFGGQGSNNLTALDDLRRLYHAAASSPPPPARPEPHHGTVSASPIAPLAINALAPTTGDLIRHAAALLSRLATSPAAASFFHGNARAFDLLTWLDHPTHAPPPHQLALAPFSFPLNTLLSLIAYLDACTRLGLQPGQLAAQVSSAIGHSQGIFAAVVVALASDWPSFLEAAELGLRLSFWTALEAHLHAPQSPLPASDVHDSLEHGEGRPSCMLAVSGLTLPALNKILASVNGTLGQDASQHLHLALINSRDRHVVAGAPETLRTLCATLRQLRASPDLDQTRVLFHTRKPYVDAEFLPISAPFHSTILQTVDELVIEDLDSSNVSGTSLLFPVYCGSDGSNLQDAGDQDVLKSVIRAVLTQLVDWPSVCKQLNVTHLVELGPGQIAKLSYDATAGRGVRIIDMINPSDSLSPRSIGTSQELLSNDSPVYSKSWKDEYAPRLTTRQDGSVAIHTKVSDVFGVPPVMVAGMTPTTVHWDVVAAITNAGYYCEIAGGGYSNPIDFETALRKLASAIPAHRSICCNILYANPQTVAWQIDILERLILEGLPIDGITIGAGIPSASVVKDFTERLRLKHISFKPGSDAAIEEVLSIAREYPKLAVGLQWTGGRAGGHHSSEDFHEPILKSYSRIRMCKNVVLIGGSGFGDAQDSEPYLTGTWAHAFGQATMPFDGILLGTRMMVAREAHTAEAAKSLLVEASGVSDEDWHGTIKGTSGGVTTIQSEMGQPIHMLATRGVMLWKELDEHVFSIKDAAKRLSALTARADEFKRRLNADFARPWLAVDCAGRNVELEDLTYEELVERLSLLMSARDKTKWAHSSWKLLMSDIMKVLEARFGVRFGAAALHPASVEKCISTALGPARHTLLYPEDTDILMSLFRRRGQKPVPFIPKLDKEFETWFKKDSLWQSENAEALLDNDIQRACIIGGPVAVHYCTSLNESAKDILDGVIAKWATALPPLSERLGEALTCDEQAYSDSAAVSLTRHNATESLPMIEFLSAHDALSGPGVHAAFSNTEISRGKRRFQNLIPAAFHVRTGDIVEIGRSTLHQIVESVVIQRTRTPLQSPGLEILRLSISETSVVVELDLPHELGATTKPTFTYHLHFTDTNAVLVEDEDMRSANVQTLYSELWKIGGESRLGSDGLASEYRGTEQTISSQDVHKYMSAVSHGDPADLQEWQPQGSLPLDFCIVIAWKALVEPLMTPALKCDFLRLLHRSIDFEYSERSSPLRCGDKVTTNSRITSLKHASSGTVVQVTADILRGSEKVVIVRTEFFLRHVDESTRQFATHRSQMTLPVQSESVAALLQRCTWLKGDERVQLLGKQLIFDLDTLNMWSAGHERQRLQISGSVKISSDTGRLETYGTIHFEDDDCLGNPVLDFIKRHGGREIDRIPLSSPGWPNAGASTTVIAPANSDKYAVVSLDTNPIHVSHALATFAGLPGSIMHGMQLSAMVRRIVEWAIGDSDRTRFRQWHASFESMVQAGQTLTIEVQHIAMQRGEMIIKAQAFNQATGERVIDAEARVAQPDSALVFTGQGAQEVGMGMALYESEMAARAIWDRGDSYLSAKYGFSLLSIVRNNPTTLTVHFGGRRGRRIRQNYLSLSQTDTPILPGLNGRSTSHTFKYGKGLLFSTQFSQPAIALMELAEHEHLKAKEVLQETSRFAGHSLGEYAALAARTSIMPFEALLDLIFYRGLKMQNALSRDADGRTEFSMVAVDPKRIFPGCNQATLETVVQLISSSSKLLLEIVNYNVKGQQYVCAGHLQALLTLTNVCNTLASSTAEAPKRLNNIKDLISSIVQTSSEHPTASIELQRGNATVPLSGIDIPFHSTALRKNIDDYRAYLGSKINASDIVPAEYIGKWIPNVTGKPFSVDVEYVRHVQEITGSVQLKELLRRMEARDV